MKCLTQEVGWIAELCFVLEFTQAAAISVHSQPLEFLEGVEVAGR